MHSSSRFAIAGLLGFAPLFLSTNGFAQQPIQLPGIYVQGATLEAPPRRTPRAAAGTDQTSAEPAEAVDGGDVGGVPLEKIGSAVTVVTGEQLRAQQVRHAGDALRSLPGVHVSQSGGPSGLTQVRLRGAEGNHTLVLVDGVEANTTTGGEFDFADLLSEDIERIEVIRGPQSGIYGSRAIGGVINVITKGGKGPLTATVRTEGGAYGTGNVSGRVSGGNDKAWFAASAQHRRSEFFNIAPVGSEEDPWRHTTVSLKGGVTIMHGLSIDFSVRDSRRSFDFDKEGSLPGPLNQAVDASNKSHSDVFLGGVNLRWDMMGGALTHVLRANRNVTDQNSLTSFGFAENLSEADKYGYLATYRFATPGLLGAKHSISGLVEQEEERFRPKSAFTDGLTRERSRLATVGEYRGEFYDRVFLTGTVRHDDNDNFADYTTWRSTVSVSLRELGMRPHASIGTAVALPGMFEQFGSILGVFVGNPNLVPEESRGWDAGVEFTIVPNRAFLDITYFQADLTNEIKGFGKSLFNLAGESERRGLELALRTQLVPWLYFGASYTFLDATEPDGAEEIRRPRNSGRVDLTYLFNGGRGTFNVVAAYNGNMKDQNFGTFPATIVTLDDYWLVTAALTYKLEPGVELFGRVENLLNMNYEEISGYNTPGIAAFAGVKFTFGGPEGLGMPWKQ